MSVEMTQVADTTPAVTVGTPVVRMRADMARPGMRNAITTRSGGSPVSRMRVRAGLKARCGVLARRMSLRRVSAPRSPPLG
jgi:hypothetical protein